MAAVTQLKKPAPESQQDPNDPLLKEMNRLLDRARIDRTRHESRISDCYRYTMPWRHRFNQNQPAATYDEIFDETPGTVLEDFSADMLNTFTPQKDNWLIEQPNVALRQVDRVQLDKALAKRREAIYSAMSKSSLYQALQEAYLDLGPGTMILLIQDIGATEPIHCEAIPLTDALLTRGPYGLVDGVFRDRKKYLRGLAKTLWPDAEWEKLGPEPQNPEEQELEITDGCWRDWTEKGTITYRYAVQCQSKIILRRVYEGDGSCPFVAARWSRDSTTAWGVGPTYRVLPAIKTLNHVRYLDLKNYDKHTDPATSFVDDGVINLDQGVKAGDWIPRAQGSDAPEAIESKSRFDVAVFERDELRSIIKRAHYQDRPEQLGKTPPTAFQWADERAERARRMGTPATNLVLELQIPVYKRFAYILEQRNTLPSVELNGEIVGLEPVSPLLRAQEQEQVLRNDRLAEMLAARFGPAIANVLINQVKFAQRQAEKLGADEDLLRDEGEIDAAIKQFAGLLKQGNAPTDIDPAAGAPLPPVM